MHREPLRRRSQHEHHHRSQNLRPAFPHVQHAVGLGRDEQGPRLSSTYVVITTDADGGLSGSGFVFTVGRGSSSVVVAHRLALPACSSAATSKPARRHARRMGHVPRLSAALARPRKGRRARGHRRRARAPSTRSRSPPASRCRTASCTSSICRRAASRSCRSAHARRQRRPGRSCSNTCSPTSSACAVPHAGGVGLCEAVRHFAVRLPGGPVDNGMIASSNMWTTSTNTSCIPLNRSMVVTRPRPLRARAST